MDSAMLPKKRMLLAGLGLGMLVSVVAASPPEPQVLNNPSVSRWVVAAGGAASNGGYVLQGAIGQAVAGNSSAGGYEVKSGYHSEDDLIFRDDLDG